MAQGKIKKQNIVYKKKINLPYVVEEFNMSISCSQKGRLSETTPWRILIWKEYGFNRLFLESVILIVHQDCVIFTLLGYVLWN